MDYDASGWAKGRVDPLPALRAYAVLSPESDGRFDAAKLAHTARTFFATRLEVVPDKSYPAGTAPLADAGAIEVAERDGAATRVFVVTMPIDRAPDVLRAANEGVRAIGGAGMDTVVRRAKRLWQIESDDLGSRAPLLVAAIFAATLLGPIVPPGGGTIYGVKGARERLAATR